MNTLLIALIAILSSLPAGTTLEWSGRQVAPAVIINELKLMEEQEKNVEETPVETPNETESTETSEEKPAEGGIAPLDGVRQA